MPTNFPGSLDSLTNPTSSDTLSGVSHSSQHANINDAMEAVQAKVGTSASTPVANSNLEGTGTGTSVWRTQAMCRAYHDANQSLTNNTLTALALNQERYDTDTMHDLVTNNSRITIKTAGKYHIGGLIQYESNATGVRVAGIRVNGSTYIGYVQLAAVSGALTALHVSADYAFAVNDYVELIGYQNSGGALNVLTSGAQSPEFWAHRIGA